MPCFGIRGAFQHPEVRVGWFPYVSLTETEIRTAPGAGKLIRRIFKGSGVGIQSVRNPKGVNPPKRSAVNGWLWCYVRATGHTGWVREADVAPDPNAREKPPLRGPGGYDFEVGRSHPLPKRKNGCGKLSDKKPHRTVDAESATLRYSGRGTAFHYLHKGDKVKLFIVDAPAGYAFAEVIALAHGRTVPAIGSRGWISQAELR